MQELAVAYVCNVWPWIFLFLWLCLSIWKWTKFVLNHNNPIILFKCLNRIKTSNDYACSGLNGCEWGCLQRFFFIQPFASGWCLPRFNILWTYLSLSKKLTWWFPKPWVLGNIYWEVCVWAFSEWMLWTSVTWNYSDVSLEKATLLSSLPCALWSQSQLSLRFLFTFFLKAYMMLLEHMMHPWGDGKYCPSCPSNGEPHSQLNKSFIWGYCGCQWKYIQLLYFDSRCRLQWANFNLRSPTLPLVWC